MSTTATTAPTPLLLTVDDVAEMLNVGVNTVKNLHRLGSLRGVIVGRHLRWKPADVERYVESLAVEA